MLQSILIFICHQLIIREMNLVWLNINYCGVYKSKWIDADGCIVRWAYRRSQILRYAMKSTRVAAALHWTISTFARAIVNCRQLNQKSTQTQTNNLFLDIVHDITIKVSNNNMNKSRKKWAHNNSTAINHKTSSERDLFYGRAAKWLTWTSDWFI